MSFTDAIRSCLAKYVTFTGRASRSEFWWFTLAVIALQQLALLTETAINAAAGTPDGRGLLSEAIGLFFFLPSVAAGWRRLHDIGRPGWWFLALVLGAPIFALIVLQLGLWSLRWVLDAGPADIFAVIAPVVAVACFAPLVYWLSRPSEPGLNKHGPNPHEVTP